MLNADMPLEEEMSFNIDDIKASIGELASTQSNPFSEEALATAKVETKTSHNIVRAKKSFADINIGEVA